MAPPAGFAHGLRSMQFATLLLRFADKTGAGAVVFGTGFLFQRNPDTVLAPDIAFVQADRLPTDDETTYLDLAPDLVVEVVSSSDSLADMHDKVLTYLETGGRMVLVLEPRRRTVTVHTPDRVARTLVVGEVLNGGDVLRGFSVPVADLFA